MCTVTYHIDQNQKVILTSNRDERIARPTLRPQIYKVDKIKLMFPKDQEAGGTWIASGSQGRLACLLNGANQPHTPGGNYAKSRGQILLDSFNDSSIKAYSEKVNLDRIEPFTLLLIDIISAKLIQLRWNGVNKVITDLPFSGSYLWCSFTLYPVSVIEKRNEEFAGWIKQRPKINRDEILKFHENHYYGRLNELEEDSIVDGLKTVSTTQIIANSKSIVMFYQDLLEDISVTTNLQIDNR